MPDADASADIVPFDRGGDERQVVAIIGAGFSGTLLALHLLRQNDAGLRVVLIERNAQFGRGPAYSTGNSSHLLNVPAAKMSAFHGEPTHFLDWLRRDGGQPDALPTEFVPRHAFGRYVRHLLNGEIKNDSADSLTLVRGDVTAIEPDEDGLCLGLDRGRALRADRVVLAVGNFPPAPPPVADRAFYDSPLYRADPWHADTLTELDPASPVLLIGTGLTMVDTVISLLDQDHTGSITALSRRGLLPNRHAGAVTGSTLAEPTAFPTGVVALARFLRERSARSVAAGGSWHAAIDELRPVTTEVWQAMPHAERRRFLRHVRPWWEIHRHRISAPVADRIEAARASGQLAIRAGHISRYDRHVGDDGAARVAVRYRPRGGRSPEASVEAARVINCAGPNADYARIRDTLVRRLLDRGLVRPDMLSLGLEVTASCALLEREGGVSRRLFAIGPVTRGTFWEMTAVPDIRQQAEFLAGRLAAICRPVAAQRAAAARRRA